MPANLIPLVTNSGRIFTTNKVTPESDGLVGIVDLTERNKSNMPSEAIFNESGDGLLVADSRHQVTLLQICNNRFNVVATNLRETPHTVCFTGKRNPHDQVLIVLKEQKRIQVHALNGKMLESIQTNLHHQLEIKSAAACPRSGLLFTLSNDSCVLWSSNQGSTIKKERSLFAQQGCHFSDAKFSPDGRQIGTLFRDGNIVIWDLDEISGQPNRQQDGQLYKYQFPYSDIKMFDFGQNMIVGAGPQFAYLVVKPTSNGSHNTVYKLPNEARGVQQLAFLTDRLLLAYISEGIFYVVDLGQQNPTKLQIALEIRLPAGSLIKRFSIDKHMNALALTATNGNVFLYNLPAAILNDQNLARKRQQMGLEKELVYTYLVAVHPSSVVSISNSQLIGIDDQQSQLSSDRNDGQTSTDKVFQNPFLTVPFSEGSQPKILSQREGASHHIASPLMSVQNRFNETEVVDMNHLVFKSEDVPVQQQLRYMNVLEDQKSMNIMGYPSSEQKHYAPMPMTAQSELQFTSAHGGENIMQPHLQQQQFSPYPQQGAPQYGLLSIETKSNINTQQIPKHDHFSARSAMHQMSQSAVSGPYLTQTTKNNVCQRQRVVPTSGPTGVQPIVQLTIPFDIKSQVSGGSSRTQDYQLINGMPTALVSSSSYQKQSIISEAIPKQTFAHSIDLNYAPEFKESDRETQAVTAQFNLPKLRRLLKQYGQFPDKYRTITWKYLLKLPLNREAFQNLLNRGVHSAYKDLHKRFPVASYRMYNKLVRILSALGHWSPVFCDISFMPAIVYSFLKVIPNDDLFVFELIMSLVVQWMQVWFEQHPAEPLSVCMAIDQILGSEDPKLVQHMRDLGFNTQHYGWPLLSSLFTEALGEDDWLKLIDHLFIKSEEPELLLYFLSSYLTCHKLQLMQIGCVEDLAVFLCQQSTVPFKKIMTAAEILHAKLKTAVFPGNCGQNLPVCSPGSIYQSFTRYPEHFVQFQNRVREKIVNQEEEIQRKTEILVDLKSKANEIAEQEERMRLQQDAMARAESDRKVKLRIEMEQLLQERIRLDELQRKARLENVQAIELAIKTSLTQQERLREEEHKQIKDEINAIQRQQKYEFESRMQDEMIANLEFKANQKLLEQLQKQQQEEHSRINREKLETLNQELLKRQQESIKRWEEQRSATRTQNQMLTHQLKVQQEQLNSDREQRFIEEKFKQVKQERDQMDQQLIIEQQARDQRRFSEAQMYKQMKQEQDQLNQQLANEQFEKDQQERDQKKWRASELIRHKEEAARQLIQERERQEKEKQARIYLDEQARKVNEEKAELERLKYQENLDRQRVAQVAEERKNEVEQARLMRAEEIAEDQRIADERRRIQEEKGKIMQARAELSQKEKTEIERRDFMKMIRTTAENVREIVKDSQQQIAYEREARLSREAAIQPHSWVAAPQEGNIPNSPQQNEVYVQDVISERERRVREQNEALREQLSLQYSQGMQMGEKENVGKTSNSYTSHEMTMTEDYQNNEGFTLRQRHAQMMTPSSTSESHYQEESSDVESYHQSKIKQMTYVGMQQVPSGHAFQPAPLHLQTHLLPFNHQLLGVMPGSKSSVGEDISSSFVSSATESQLNFNGMQRPEHLAAYGDYLSDSMLTSSYEGGSQYIDNQIKM